MKKAYVKFITGYSTRRFLLLDLDNTTEEKAIALASMIIDCEHVGNCLMVRSSSHPKVVIGGYKDSDRRLIAQHQFIVDGSYHLIFGKPIGYDRICSIIESLAVLGVLDPSYANLRNWRSDLTLRISPDNSTDKPRPQPAPVAFLFDQFNPIDDGITEYWQYRKEVESFFQQIIAPT